MPFRVKLLLPESWSLPWQLSVKYIQVCDIRPHSKFQPFFLCSKTQEMLILVESIEYTSNAWKQDRKMSTCNRLDWESLGSWPTMPKNSPGTGFSTPRPRGSWGTFAILIVDWSRHMETGPCLVPGEIYGHNRSESWCFQVQQVMCSDHLFFSFY